MKDSHERWLTLLPWEKAQPPTCPSCGEQAIDYQILEYKQTGMGWAFIWCAACRKGIHISRMKVPAGAKAISSDTLDATKNSIPPFEINLIH